MSALALIAALALAGPPTFGKPELAGVIINPDLDELSGLTGSRRRTDLLWVHNDSGNPNEIYAIDLEGHLRATYTIANTPNTDWEDIVAFTLDGEPYLLIADVGDNGALRKELALIVVREPVVPDTATKSTLDPAWTIRFRYPDGPRDCEAVTIDPRSGEVLLMSKRRVPGQLFMLPLKPPAGGGEPLVARQIALAQHVPQPSAEELAADPKIGRYLSQITAMALAPDDSELALLTYRDVYVYPRVPGEPWQSTLAREPHALGLPRLPQAEGLGYLRDGSALYVTGERLPAPLVRIPRRRPE